MDKGLPGQRNFLRGTTMTSRLAAATAAKPKLITKTRIGTRRALDLLVVSLVALTAILAASLVTTQSAHAHLSPLTSGRLITVQSAGQKAIYENPVPTGLRAAVDGGIVSEVSPVHPPELISFQTRHANALGFRHNSRKTIGVFALLWMLFGMAAVTFVMWRDSSKSWIAKPASRRIN